MNANIDIRGVYLESKNLILRPFLESDLEDFYNYCKVDGVGEMAGWIHHKSLEESKLILNIFIKEKKTFAIVDKESRKVIGSIGLETYNENVAGEKYKNLKCREIGYVLSKEYWGRSYMPQAVKRILEYCFKDLDLDAVFCGYFKRNLQSKRVNEKLGFKNIGECIFKTRYGSEEDSVYTVISKEEFMSNNNW